MSFFSFLYVCVCLEGILYIYSYVNFHVHDYTCTYNGLFYTGSCESGKCKLVFSIILLIFLLVHQYRVSQVNTELVSMASVTSWLAVGISLSLLS